MNRKRKEKWDVSKMSCLKRYARLSLIFLLLSTFWIRKVCAHPTITINKTAGEVDPTKAGPINFSVIFCESVSIFTASNVTLGGTVGVEKTVTSNRFGFSQIASIDRGMQ